MAIYGPGYRKSHKYPSQDWLNNDDIYTTIISGGENEEIFLPNSPQWLGSEG